MIRLVFILSFITCSTYLSAQNEGAEILEEHFRSYGQEQWNQIRTVSIDGRWVDEDYYGYPMKLTFKAPDKIKITGTYKRQRYAEAYDGQVAWIIAPWKKKYEVELMSPQEEMVLRNSFSLGSPLYTFREHLKFTGLRDMEGRLYHTFELTETNFNKVFYLGREDHKLYYEQITTRFGAELQVLKIFEKYKSYGELLMPTAVIFEGEGLEKELIFDEIYMGMGASDSIFEMPESQ